MGSFFGSSGSDYGADTVMFALSVVFLALPLAALIAASLLDGLMRQRAGRRLLAPAPLSLRGYRRGSGALRKAFGGDQV